MEGYVHVREVQRRQLSGVHLLARVHQVVSLLKRRMLGTHHGSISDEHLDDYLNEFAFRFNRRGSASRDKLFYRLAQQTISDRAGPLCQADCT
jgi:transposase-like protein